MILSRILNIIITYPSLIFLIAMIGLTIYMVNTLKIVYQFNRNDFKRQLREDIVLWILNFIQVIMTIYYLR